MFLINDKKDYTKAIKEGYKNDNSFFSVINLLKLGNTRLKIEPDYKELYKFLIHHLKNKNSKISKTVIYFQLADVCAVLGKHEEKNDHLIEAYRLEYKNKNGTPEKERVTFNLFECLLSKSFNSNKKLIDKNSLKESVNFLFEYLNIAGKIEYSFKSQTSDLVKEVFGSDKFGYKNLYIVHYFTGKRDKQLLLQFEEKDFIEYPKILEKSRLSLDYDKALLEYLTVAGDYLYFKKDNESKVKYALFKASKTSIFAAEPKYFSLIHEAYNDGYKEALYYICKDLLDKRNYKEATKLLTTHIKQHSKDHANLLSVAQYIIDNYVDKNQIVKSGAEEVVKKAISIYEKFYKQLKEKQLNFLYEIYVRGVLVKKNLDKIKLYNTNCDAHSIKVIELLDKEKEIKYLNSESKEKIATLFNKIRNGESSKIFTLAYNLTKEKGIEVDPSLIHWIANTFIEKYPQLNYILGKLYLDGIGCDKDISKAKNYLINAIESGVKHAFYLFITALEIEANESNNFDLFIKQITELHNRNINIASLKLASYYLLGTHVEKDINKAKEIAEHLYENKFYISCLILTQYYYLIPETENLDLAMKYAKEGLENTNHWGFYDEITTINHRSNYKYFSKEETFEMYLKTENKNSSSDFYWNLYYCYSEGNVCEQNFEKALKYLETAAKMNNTYAILALARYKLFGNKLFNIAKNSNEAYELYKKVDKKEYRDIDYCYYALTAIFSTKNKNYKESFEILKSLENKGDILNSSFGLGLHYFYGIYKKEDLKTAYEYFKKTEEYNKYYSYAYRALTILTAKINFENNGQSWQKCAAELAKPALEISEDSFICSVIAAIYFEDDLYEKSYKYYEKALKNSNTFIVGYRYIGNFYAKGLYVKQDIDKALEYYEIGFNKGDTTSSFYIAKECYELLDNEKYETKFNQYIHAAMKEKGFEIESSEYYLSYLIWNKKDYKEAYEFIKASNGLLDETESYGDLLYHGYYVNTNYDHAFEIYSKNAKETSRASAYYKLGICYFYGRGVEKDNLKAKENIKIAAESNYVTAQKFYQEFFENK